MKRTKRVLILTAAISGAFAAGVYAQDVLERVDAYLRPDFNLVLDGKPVQLSGPTLVYNDKSYLPLKELGNLLGASILWRNDTKTIYINSRINPEQAADNPEQTYDTIELSNPYSIKVSYLGAEYPLLLTYDSKGKSSSDLYYRLSDVKRMGIDTDGLKKAKERLTGQLFVNEKELRKRWKQTPTPTSSGSYDSYVIAGEINPKKLEALKGHVKTLASFKVGEQQFSDKPIIIDKTDEEDTYELLMYETVRFTSGPVSMTNRYHLVKLQLYKKNDSSPDVGYSVNMTSKMDLAAEADKREDK
ncbi:hypothetical protein O9H85_02685 [Paenibacillus filicis]|uniref:Copper amine oxidase-like N-terminal domain-containing protein n=1 Tax=Paenibacillus gyeongsangnamensis TaxID=3388067 RepID=A0ABT4Q3T4_9BACL|nr:hypothetical protein [Paenibacillus filicis]MCZ8511360.1 hypothetical protein [Paenibacillus filicis]